MVKNLQCLKTSQICYLTHAEHHAKNRMSVRGLDHDTLFFNNPLYLGIFNSGNKLNMVQMTPIFIRRAYEIKISWRLSFFLFFYVLMQIWGQMKFYIDLRDMKSDVRGFESVKSSLDDNICFE